MRVSFSALLTQEHCSWSSLFNALPIQMVTRIKSQSQLSSRRLPRSLCVPSMLRTKLAPTVLLIQLQLIVGLTYRTTATASLDLYVYRMDLNVEAKLESLRSVKIVVLFVVDPVMLLHSKQINIKVTMRGGFWIDITLTWHIITQVVFALGT